VPAANSDELGKTVDYQGIYELVLAIMAERVDLLETLTVQIGEEILRRFETVDEARVRVSKLRPLGMSQCQRTYVELKFERHG
jgi:7,8-dihydroneopterin aldolase/epimerase/oxygenase